MLREPPLVTLLPDTATTLVVRQAPGGDREVLVAGPRTRALYHRQEPGPGPGPTCLEVRIRPGRARPLVGRSLAALADRVVPDDDAETEEDER